VTGFVPDPAAGRLFAASRIVRSTDVTPTGRLRFDAIARYLQDVAEDDVNDAGWDEPHIWLLRRCALAVQGYPALGDTVTLRTYCSAIGPRWAERTTTLAAQDGDVIQAKALWVAVARHTGAPAPLSERFHGVYGPSAQGQRASARLFHPAPGADLTRRPWPLRASDFDSARHVNNSVHWMAAEDVLADPDWLPGAAEIEYPRPILPGCEPALLTATWTAGLDLWLAAGSDVLASIRLSGPSRSPLTPGSGIRLPDQLGE
jgi:acyl-ACP thioesterase